MKYSKILTAPHGFYGEGETPPFQESARVKSLTQIHGTRVHLVEHRNWECREGDGFVTSLPGVILTLTTADCLPVLWQCGNTVAACHAGWRGLVGGVLERTWDVLKTVAPSQPCAVTIGPAIAQRFYEVGEDMRAEALNLCPMAEPFFAPANQKWLFDLKGLAVAKLKALDIASIDALSEDTFSGPYHSRRRALGSATPSYGLNLSWIQAPALFANDVLGFTKD